jgi:hypothetical protein
MFTHPCIGSQLATEPQREMLAQAGQQRLVRHLREHARASRRAERGRPADDPPAQAHPPSGAPHMNRTAAASSHPSWADPSWPH